MANQIQIKRSSGTALPTSVAVGELAYSGNGEVLFIGSVNGTANSANVVAIGGARNPGILTANQAIVTNSSSWVDVVKTAKLTIGAITETINVTSISTFANSSQLGGVSGSAGGNSNTELVTSYAVKTYIDSKSGGLPSTYVGYGLSLIHI